ncbi:hypothetical protein ACOSQ4_028392 [Xanthoceras sorbifolium]
MARVLQLKQQLQNTKKGSLSISDYCLKIKTLGEALKAAGQTVSEYDMVLSVLNGLGHDYDPVVVLLSSQHKAVTMQETQYLLMVPEQRIDQLNIVSQVDDSPMSANFASNNAGNSQRGGHNSNGRGNSNSRRGYSVYHKGYKCLHSSGRVYISRHIIFNEIDFPFQTLFSSSSVVQNSAPSLPISVLHSISHVCTSSSPSTLPLTELHITPAMYATASPTSSHTDLVPTASTVRNTPLPLSTVSSQPHTATSFLCFSNFSKPFSNKISNNIISTLQISFSIKCAFCRLVRLPNIFK